jgi:hypothetical protein
MPRTKKAPVSKAKAKAKKPSGRPPTAKAAARLAKKPAKMLAKAKTAPARPRQAAVAPTQTYLGQVVSFPYNFAPSGWVACTGRLLPISQFTALFSLIGTTYGGDGKTDFMLPNLPPRGPNGPWYCIAIEGAYPPRG